MLKTSKNIRRLSYMLASNNSEFAITVRNNSQRYPMGKMLRMTLLSSINFKWLSKIGNENKKIPNRKSEKGNSLGTSA